MKFKSPIVKSKLSCEEIFNKISNLNNLKEILPKEISEYNSTSDKCSFKIENLPKINLKIKSLTLTTLKKYFQKKLVNTIPRLINVLLKLKIYQKLILK